LAGVIFAIPPALTFSPKPVEFVCFKAALPGRRPEASSPVLPTAIALPFFNLGAFDAIALVENAQPASNAIPTVYT
jgi:hypothetical protein